MSTLKDRVELALESRRRRQILRRLPSPSPSVSSSLIDFCSNDYLGLSTYTPLRELYLRRLQNSPDILGSGGSRLLVNGSAHHSLEERLAQFFDSPAALLFNSGFDANVGFFSCIPQAGDVVVYDEYIHASVHDGIRASRARHPDAHFSFNHNSVSSLRNLFIKLLEERSAIRSGKSSVIIAVESLYSMDGTFAPLADIIELMDAMLPFQNGYLVVDEAHSTGIYGDQGRGLVSMLGLESRVFARLHTFGKALAGSGAVVLTHPSIKQYLLNYARSLIYTTSLSNANIIAVECSFDMLEDQTAAKLAGRLMGLAEYTIGLLRQLLQPFPPNVIFLPHDLSDNFSGSNRLFSPIIPVMTSYARPLSTYLRNAGFNARPITWPTVPKGKDRVRVCLHANNTKGEVEGLVNRIVSWADAISNRNGHRDQSVAEAMEAKL